MTTYPLSTEKVNVFAFEVSVLETGQRSIAKLLQNINGVSNVSVREPFSPSNALVKFAYQSVDFVVCEPFGDNGRYWIGPLSQTHNHDMDISGIEQEFRLAPSNRVRSFLARIFG